MKNSLNATSSNKTSPKQGKLFFISAGDPSGDEHAARLVNELSNLLPDARFIGYAGPKTAATCCDVRFDLTKFAVMMLYRAILNIPNYLRLLSQAEKIFRQERPDAVILVDFPGFNWKIAQKAKALGVPVIYFMPPQIWGWGQWRVKKMRKYVDLVLSCFSFEDVWFREHGCRSVLVGHPFFEEIRSRKLDLDFVNSLLVSNESKATSESLPKSSPKYLTILPGSRNQEVVNNLPSLLATIKKVLQVSPDIVPIFAAYKDSQAEFIKTELANQNLNFPTYVGKTPELMRIATCCLGVSGSVSIELLSLLKPTVILYHISKLEYFVLRFLKKVKYITLTNLLAVDNVPGETPFYPQGYLPKSTSHTPHEREMMLFPEYITSGDCSSEAANDLLTWLQDEKLLEKRIDELATIKKLNDRIVDPIKEAASKIVEEINR